ncbi:MAG: hypothetical protein EXX96DRAFT_563968 [Benjaminiella poitrasii]|nr:MAG: hypothetical protein EXX96DRAFT_563968 [Benjaminiella poitrasii]
MLIRPYYHTISTLLCFVCTFWILPSIGMPTSECIHPTNYSDFTLLLVNNSLIATGGNSQTLEIWTRDLSDGLDIKAENCWTNVTAATNNNYSPYKNGIGFKITDSSFAIQAGDSTLSSMSSLALFDLLNQTWTTPLTQGTSPSHRARMSVSLDPTTNVVYFYGGRTELSQQPRNYFNSFYNFDIKTSTWNWPETAYSGGVRPARYGHSSNLISDRLFIIGGKAAVFSSDLNSWTFSSGDFQSILVYDTTQHQAITMATIGDIPPARYSFSTVNAPDGKSIVLFGGQNASSEEIFDASNDIYILDTCTLNWSQPTVEGKPPIARAGHEAIVYKNRYMLIFMGIQNYISGIGPVYVDDIAILDMKSWTWISSISKEEEGINPNMTTPDCRFIFPVIVPDNDNDNENIGNSNVTIVSNQKSSPTTKQLALGITFGVLGFLLLTTTFVIFIIRIRKDVDPKQNPRWIPSALKIKSNRQQQQEQ